MPKAAIIKVESFDDVGRAAKEAARLSVSGGGYELVVGGQLMANELGQLERLLPDTHQKIAVFVLKKEG